MFSTFICLQQTLDSLLEGSITRTGFGHKGFPLGGRFNLERLLENLSFTDLKCCHDGGILRPTLSLATKKVGLGQTCQKKFIPQPESIVIQPLNPCSPPQFLEEPSSGIRPPALRRSFWNAQNLGCFDIGETDKKPQFDEGSTFAIPKSMIFGTAL